MKTCDRTGCNAPQGHCESDGDCMTHSMFSTKASPCDQFYSSRETELPIDFAGDEPIQWIQAAAGYVALLLAVISVVAFIAGYFA